jgi:hypothetical protein
VRQLTQKNDDVCFVLLGQEYAKPQVGIDFRQTSGVRKMRSARNHPAIFRASHKSEVGHSQPKWAIRLTSAFPEERRLSGHCGTFRRCDEETQAPQQLCALFDHLVGAQRSSNFGIVRPEGLGGFEIDD